MASLVSANVCQGLLDIPSKSKVVKRIYSDDSYQVKRTHIEDNSFINSPKKSIKCELSVAVCCSANVNRSMAAHKLLKEHGIKVKSFGVSSSVRLPAPGGQVKEYSFGTPYSTILKELKEMDEKWYNDQLILYLMERNSNIKESPQRFQDYSNIDQFNVIICCDMNCYRTMSNYLINRTDRGTHPIDVFGIDVPDTPREAEVWSYLLLHLCNQMKSVKKGVSSLKTILKQYEEEDSINIEHSIFIV